METRLDGLRGEIGAAIAAERQRIQTNIGEFDEVVGGGIVPGSLVLLGGDPGIGKSTLLLQAVCKLSVNNRVAYISGEEAIDQMRMRAGRPSGVTRIVTPAFRGQSSSP